MPSSFVTAFEFLTHGIEGHAPAQAEDCNICLNPLITTQIQNATPDPFRDVLSYFIKRNKLSMPIQPEPEPAVQIKQCGHIFGINCLMTWFEENETCPMCRVVLFGDVHLLNDAMRTINYVNEVVRRLRELRRLQRLVAAM
ncbi:hypothetical protein CC80DRAFT_572064 [Byssothecium circinans]|uniref:RING-type domain-containing protein n=1 Tax=Byssothecium circinans TaxID=147558 RepID=A0A6A5TL55_9PLEO|nr:hypothetical protein CC80DRAFT_572064 [Byssothecium circinans]